MLRSLVTERRWMLVNLSGDMRQGSVSLPRLTCAGPTCKGLIYAAPVYVGLICAGPICAAQT